MPNSPSRQNSVRHFESLGIHLWLDGEKLKYKASKESVTPEILEELKASKASLIEELKSRVSESDVKIVIDRENRFEPFPLTDVQSAYLLGRNKTFDYGGVACHVYLEILYRELDAEKVRKIWNALVRKYDMLHAIIDASGFQRVMREVPELEIPEWDLRNHPEESREFEKFRKEMSSRAYIVGKWPMFGIAVSHHADSDILHFSIEFLIADWTSIYKLLAEFEAAYFDGIPVSGEEELSFRDYLAAERKIRNEAQYEKEKKYWTDRIGNLPEAPELPKLPVKESKNSFQRKFLRLSPEDWARIKSRAKQNGLTPTVPILACYADVLGKWSENKRFCVNLTVLNRLPLHEKVQEIVGDFTSLDLLEIDLSAGGNFLERARRINGQLFSDLDNRLFSGVEVMREISRQTKKTGISMPIVYTSAIGLAGAGTPLRGEFRGGISQTPQTFIDCQVMDGEFGLQVNWDYREGVFPENVLDEMFQTFESHLQNIAKKDSDWSSTMDVDLPARDAAEQAEANHTEKKWDARLLQDDFIESVKRNPEKIAVDDGNFQFSFEELDIRAKALAAELIRLGVKPQEPIPVLMGKSAWQIVSVLGILYAGAIYIPIAAASAMGRAEKIIRQAEAKVAVGISSDEDLLPGELQTVHIDELKTGEHPLDRDALPKRTPEDIAYIIYTSGSTGEPKGVVITHKGAMNTIDDMNDRFDVRAEDSVLGLSQLNFDLSVYDIFGVLGCGGTVFYPTAEDYMNPEAWENLLLKHKITVWNSVPALMQMLLNFVENKDEEKQLPLQKVFLSGDWIPVNMPEKIRHFANRAEVICLGGATEASIWSNFHRYDPDDGLQILPYGKPLANQTMHILDSQLAACPTWVAGQIAIGGEGVALGYYKDEARTNAQFIHLPQNGERVYLTGDIGRYLPGGEIEFLGRKDSQVKIRGHRIELGEIENVLKEFPGIKEAVATVSEDKREIDAAIVAENATPESTATEKKLFSTRKKFVEGLLQKDIGEIPLDKIQAGYEAEERACTYTILIELQKMGLFESGKPYRLEDLKAPIISKYHWLLNQWISFLLSQNRIERSGDAYICRVRATEAEKDSLWEQAKSVWNGDCISADFLEYVQVNGEHLCEILQGKVDPGKFLYPETGDKYRYVDSLYVNNKIMGIANRSLVKYVEELFKEHPEKTFRILEVGAGTGSVTRHLLPALKGKSFEYYFTDYLKHFFPTAEERFKDYPELVFKQLDLNQDFIKQGISPNYFDIVIGGYVLDNVIDLDYSLGQIENAIAPGGFEMFLESFENAAWISVTQALLMDVPPDDLQKQEEIFEQLKMPWAKWEKKLRRGNPDANLCVFPESEAAQDRLHLMFFVKQVKADKQSIDSKDLNAFLDKYLLHYMQPNRIQIFDRLPLSPNGKIDRKAIGEFFKKSTNGNPHKNAVHPPIESENSTEGKLFRIVNKALNVSDIGIEDNFYDFGADSLLMAQMATSIRNEIAPDKTFDAILKQLLDFPTVKNLSQFLTRDAEEDSEDSGNFVLLRRQGSPNGKTGRILLPTILWNGEMYRELIPLLENQDDGEIFTFQLSHPKKFFALNPAEVANALNSAFAEEVLKSRIPKVQIIGYSFNGKLALDLAERLEDAGVEVLDIVIIDGARLPFESSEIFVRDLFFAQLIHADAQKMGFQFQDLSSTILNYLEKTQKKSLTKEDFQKMFTGSPLAGTVERFMDMDEEERTLFIQECAGDFERNLSKESFAQMKKTFDQNFQAMIQFEPTPYFGDLRYLKTDNSQGIFKNTSQFLFSNWDDLCIGNVHYGELEGDHFSAFTDKVHVLKLAEALSIPQSPENSR